MSLVRRVLSHAHACFDTLALTAIATAAASVLGRYDPNLSRGAQSWLALAPLVCAAQHGTSAGLISGAGLGLYAIVSARLGYAPALDVSAWLGCAVAGMIAGEFRKVWQRRRNGALENERRSLEQLQRVQRAHYLLKLSHARLEERLAGSRWSLAGALASAELRMTQLDSAADLGRVLLDVLANHASVQAAALYWSDAKGRLSARPLATLSSAQEAAPPDPLTLRAWKTRRLVTVAQTQPNAFDSASGALATVPLLSAEGRALGVVAVYQLPFMALSAPHLRNLLVLASQLADRMQDRIAALAVEREQSSTSNCSAA